MEPTTSTPIPAAAPYEPESRAALYDAYGHVEWDRLQISAHGRRQATIHTDFLRDYVKAGDRVLDAGCGPGRFAIELCRLGAHVVAVDTSAGQLDLARQRFEAAGLGIAPPALQQADIVDLGDLEDGSFDATVCFGGALSYVRDRRQQAADELMRVTRPGGVILVSVMSRFGSACNVVRQAGIADPVEPPRLRSILDTGEPSGAPSSKVPGRLHPAMHLYDSDELCRLFSACGVLTVAGSNVTLAQGNQAANALLEDEEAWANTIDIERRCCRQSGLVDSGSHLILAARKRAA